MSIRTRVTGSEPPTRLRNAIVAPRRWALWSQPSRVVVYCLATEAAAVATTLWLHRTPTAGQLALLAVMITLAIVQAELGRHFERVRRRVGSTLHINMTSVWTFAAVLVLPPSLTATLTVILYAHLAARSWHRLHRAPTWRTVNNASLIVLTCHAAHTVLTVGGVTDLRSVLNGGWRCAAVLLAAIGAYFVVNALIVLPARTTVGRTPVQLFGTWSDNGLELATLCLGALNALALVTQPVLAVLVVPPLLFLQRTLHVRQLEAAVNRDQKTGLLNLTGWTAVAEEALVKVDQHGRPIALLMIDLDHFREINSRYGHLGGDDILKVVATTITRTVRDHNDAVGRFGGEEFVVLLPNITDPDDVRTVAERVRAAVNELEIELNGANVTGLSVSIGTALYPAAGTTIRQLLNSADGALYLAKDAGRNQTVSSDLARSS
ncbi:sensor domain-containing diguanylate cyclase [Amycolatopsis suaedae]|uniref:GGDEF domain-containing protein n=1 Tax=Amycolatopsis suaedae TaxID=2510978 RepID=A0A4Q7IYN9_9PSEU|nr:GGDEF domain-containing protein [Amycolatopsis suaedae]RZQ60100.1 GGDEF domain-containing protein [Amycolatopsis suaedae]